MSATLTGNDLKTDVLYGASDLFIQGENCYIADTQNNRILRMNLDSHLVTETIDGFWRDGQREGFSAPNGVFVNDEDEVYIADTQNYRVVHLDAARNLVKIIENPQADVINEGYVFKPRKLAVDTGGRVYVVAEGTTEGILQFSSDGEFIRYFGGSEAKVNFAELFLRMFLNKEQRQKRSTFIPIEYSNITIDAQNFLYTTTVNTYSNQARRLNFQGSNIMRYTGRFGARMGDLHETELPYMVDICVDEAGNVAILDSKRGRIYVYNQLGELLAIFGGYGTQNGQFRSPTALECADGSYYVLDSVKASITVFEPTDFGRLIMLGNNAYFNGEYEISRAAWEEVLTLNSNYDLAYKSIANAMLKEENYLEAMDYYQRANDRQGYSEAFEAQRTRWMRQNFPMVMTGLIVLVAVMALTKKPRSRLSQRIRAYFELD